MRILAYLNMFPLHAIQDSIPESVEQQAASQDQQQQQQENNGPINPTSKSLLGPIPGGPSTILCSRGFWIYTKTGGVLEVYPAVNTIVRKGDLIARIKNIFGNIVDEIFSPSHGVVCISICFILVPSQKVLL
jgi:hypothetical protein